MKCGEEREKKEEDSRGGGRVIGFLQDIQRKSARTLITLSLSVSVTGVPEALGISSIYVSEERTGCQQISLSVVTTFRLLYNSILKTI